MVVKIVGRMVVCISVGLASSSRYELADYFTRTSDGGCISVGLAMVGRSSVGLASIGRNELADYTKTSPNVSLLRKESSRHRSSS